MLENSVDSQNTNNNPYLTESYLFQSYKPISFVQITALETELMQLMKQNGIQVNNNNNNGVNSLSERGATPQCAERHPTVGGEPQTHINTHSFSTLIQEAIHYMNGCLYGRQPRTLPYTHTAFYH